MRMTGSGWRPKRVPDSQKVFSTHQEWVPHCQQTAGVETNSENRLPLQGPHKIYITYKTLRLLCTKPQNSTKTKSLSQCLQNLCPLPPEKWPFLTSSASQSFHILLYFKSQLTLFTKMCKSQWIWIEFDKSHRIGKMLFYLTSAVTHLNFYIM